MGTCLCPSKGEISGNFCPHKGEKNNSSNIHIFTYVGTYEDSPIKCVCVCVCGCVCMRMYMYIETQSLVTLSPINDFRRGKFCCCFVVDLVVLILRPS